MKALRPQSGFRKDLKRITKRRYNLAKLAVVIDVLRNGQPLPPARRDHPLKGDWQDFRECHIEPDWLLIYQITGEHVVLARTGTHADLFNTWCGGRHAWGERLVLTAEDPAGTSVLVLDPKTAKIEPLARLGNGG